MKSFRQYLKENSIHDHVDHFVDYACNHLGIENPPTINLVDDKSEAAKNSSFGGYSPSDKTIHVNIAGRHPVDVMRTLAHELAHHKQDLDNRITKDSGNTGSDIENEANAQAGVIMRNYGKLNTAIFESAEHGGSLHAFDVDGTLMHTTARVHVRNHKGERVASLSHSEFNDHVKHKKLGKDQHYDFSEFRSAHHFNKEKPIRPMLAKLKAIHKATQKNPHSKVILNTARSDFDNKHHFAKTWKKFGVNITPKKGENHIHVERAGNDTSNRPIGEKKADIMRKHLKTGKYREAHLYDDDTNNLHHFLKLKKEFPHVEFHAHHVQHDGSTKKYKEE
jgi:hypothetical protein